MYEKVKSIEITFENMDYVDIPIKYFGNKLVINAERSIRRDSRKRVIDEIKVKEVYLEIAIEASDHLKEFNHDIGTGSTPLKDRLKYNDITQLRIHHYDKKYDDLHVCWEDRDDNEFENKHQISVIGDKWITIQILEDINE